MLARDEMMPFRIFTIDGDKKVSINDALNGELYRIEIDLTNFSPLKFTGYVTNKSSLNSDGCFIGIKGTDIGFLVAPEQNITL